MRGTTSAVEDRRGSTVTIVREGLVAVRGIARRPTVLVRRQAVRGAAGFVALS